VARGIEAVGSTAGAGTSICGGGAAGGASVCFGRSSHREPSMQKARTTTRPATRRTVGLTASGRRAVAPATTPGICGISALNLSDLGWSIILSPYVAFRIPDELRAANALRAPLKDDGRRFGPIVGRSGRRSNEHKDQSCLGGTRTESVISTIGRTVIEMGTNLIPRLVSSRTATYCNGYGKSVGGEAVPSSERNL
jgi:hypothetical protein